MSAHEVSTRPSSLSQQNVVYFLMTTIPRSLT
jgi:hypothetical protein